MLDVLTQSMLTCVTWVEVKTQYAAWDNLSLCPQFAFVHIFYCIF